MFVVKKRHVLLFLGRVTHYNEMLVNYQNFKDVDIIYVFMHQSSSILEFFLL